MSLHPQDAGTTRHDGTSVRLDARGLTLDADGQRLLDAVSLTLRAGELLGVIGPNGAGKSTLLKLLAGVQQPGSGELWLEGKPFAALTPRARARKLAWLEQRPTVQWPLCVEQVVALGRLPHGKLYDAAAASAIAAALQGTDTTALAMRAFHTLSEGEKLRVNLARVLAGNPALLLADEPVAALDPWHQLQTMELLQQLARGGMAVLVVLHDLTLAARFCDSLLLLDKGRCVAQGTPQEVLSREHLASVYRVAAEFDPAAQRLRIDGRLPA